MTRRSRSISKRSTRPSDRRADAIPGRAPLRLCRHGGARCQQSGHGYPGAIVGATLIDGERELSTMGESPALLLVQGWVDSRQVLVDLSDPEAMERVVLLTVRTINKDGDAAGTLAYKGRSYAVRCGESG